MRALPSDTYTLYQLTRLSDNRFNQLLEDGRNLTAGQRAMAVAMLRPEGDKGGRGKTSTETLSFRQRTTEARAVLSYSREVALIYPEQQKRGRGHKSPINGDFPGVAHQRVAEDCAGIRNTLFRDIWMSIYGLPFTLELGRRRVEHRHERCHLWPLSSRAHLSRVPG